MRASLYDTAVFVSYVRTAIINIQRGISMKNYSNYQKIALLSLGVFALFLILFFIASALVQSRTIPEVTFSQAVQGVLAFILFFPLLSALFFTGQHLKAKAGNAQTVYKLLTFVSVSLFILGIVQMFLSIIGIYG